MLQLPFFRMLVEGNFDHVSTTLVAGVMKRSPESEAFVAQAKAERTARGIKAWPNDAKPSRFHFIGVEPEGDTLKFLLDPSVTYDEHVAGTSDEFCKLFGWDFLPNALATTFLLVSGGHMLVTLRKKADSKKGGLHFSGGGFPTLKDEPDGNLHHAVVREINEETGLEPGEITSLVCRGVAWEIGPNKPDALFIVKTNVSVEELRRRKHDDENTLFWMPTTREHVSELLIKGAHSVTRVGMAALLLYGKDRFGEEWYQTQVAVLRKEGEGYDDPAVQQEKERIAIANVPALLERLCGRAAPAAR